MNKRLYAFTVLAALVMSLYVLVNHIPQPVPEIPANGPAYEPCLTQPLPPEPVDSFAPVIWPEGSAIDRPAVDVLSDLDANSVVDLGDVAYYGFRDHGYASLTPDGTQLPYNVYYGVSGEVQGGELLVAWHNYTGNGATPTNVTVHSIYYDAEVDVGPLRVAQGERQSVAVRELPTGPYILRVGWDNGATTALCFYRNGNELYTCQQTGRGSEYMRCWYDRQNTLERLMDANGATPENSLDYSDDFWAYPVPADYNWKYRCDNHRWIGLARELVGNEILPDAQKAVLVHDWMTANLAYDNYKAYGLEMTRAKYHNDYSGKYSMWDTHVGVCADFASVYAIMLRSVGVPCVCIDEDDEHVWNVAYIDGQWVEIDVTQDVERYVMTEDVQDVITFPDVDMYGAFGVPFDFHGLDPGRNRINSGVYTRELVTGRSNMNRS